MAVRLSPRCPGPLKPREAVRKAKDGGAQIPLPFNPPIACSRMAKTRVALYARVSREGQDLEHQLVRLREWAERMDYEVAGEFSEIASGRLFRRPEHEKVMKLVRGRHIHAVAVAKLDRWGRSMIDLRNSINEMVENGVKFIAVDAGIVYDKHSPTGKILIGQLSLIAEFEADLISERTKDGLQAAVARGKILGRPLEPCWACGGERKTRIKGKRGGIVRSLCAACKAENMKKVR